MEKVSFDGDKLIDRMYEALPPQGRPKKNKFKPMLAREVWEFVDFEELDQNDAEEMVKIMQWICGHIQ